MSKKSVAVPPGLAKEAIEKAREEAKRQAEQKKGKELSLADLLSDCTEEEPLLEKITFRGQALREKAVRLFSSQEEMEPMDQFVTLLWAIKHQGNPEALFWGKTQRMESLAGMYEELGKLSEDQLDGLVASLTQSIGVDDQEAPVEGNLQQPEAVETSSSGN